ncbi:hypothetical protein NEMIN01_1009 [Nematocida minor]|uniref:uncharacterized protein n=1 Tax=Nematocida minor TaxID=1912983 RepID=UPI00221E5963|nr:uncharacterized protein NEMIN01_1009 [Nematocida minor]KAI5190385.1 hypothetical protein NEMIN01_1009 [Nematocida minor]
MILQRILKKTVVGIVALSYLQRSSCADKEMISIRDYWGKNIDCMKKAIRVRLGLLDEIRSICEEEPSDVLSKSLKEGEANMSNIKTDFLTLYLNTESILEKIELLDYLSRSGGSDKDADHLYEQIRKLLASNLDDSDLACDRIHKFDSHMLDAIGEYSSQMNNTDVILQELTLFKLAKSNKPFAVDMLYALIRAKAYKPGYVVEDTLNYIGHEMRDYLFSMDFESYNSAIWDDVDKGEFNLFASADKHFSLLFTKYGADKEVMDIYFDLIKEDISEEEADKYMDITPGQIIKLILIEMAMNADLMDYRTNSLFCNLGKIIVRIGRAANGNRKNKKKGLRIIIERRDRILEALTLLWNDCIEINKATVKESIELFCRDNNIEIDRFENIQKDFSSAKWMYKLKIANPTTEKIDAEPKLLRKHYFAMSCTHPMYYLYQQCEDIKHLARKDLESNKELLIERDSDGIFIFRIYKIGNGAIDNLEKAHIMKNCIRIWFEYIIKIFYRIEDGKEYSFVAYDFERYLNQSQYVLRAKAYTTDSLEKPNLKRKASNSPTSTKKI